MVRRCGVALAGGLLWSACHLLLGHEPPASHQEGGPRAADLVRQRREHRPGSDAASSDGGASVDQRATDGVASPPLFFDDFSKAGGLVDDGVGSWSVTGGVYRQTTCQGIPESAVAGQAWGDITVRTRVRADALCSDFIFPLMNEAGLLVRIASYKPAGCTNNRYYYCVLDFWSSELFVGERKGSWDCVGADNGGLQLPKLQLGTWYELELTAKGKEIRCRAKVGGQWLSALWTDTSASVIATGSAGLVADEIKASFDELEVRAAP